MGVSHSGPAASKMLACSKVRARGGSFFTARSTATPCRPCRPNPPHLGQNGARQSGVGLCWVLAPNPLCPSKAQAAERSFFAADKGTQAT